mmetsp:Transcript_50887/g.94823  ORF Transcript_50887/g.94823 Transcript_50887/m.94823 type:complete len:919 (+) Transcript_50887:66-2822(+)
MLLIGWMYVANELPGDLAVCRVGNMRSIARSEYGESMFSFARAGSSVASKMGFSMASVRWKDKATMDRLLDVEALEVPIQADSAIAAEETSGNAARILKEIDDGREQLSTLLRVLKKYFHPHDDPPQRKRIAQLKVRLVPSASDPRRGTLHVRVFIYKFTEEDANWVRAADTWFHGGRVLCCVLRRNVSSLEWTSRASSAGHNDIDCVARALVAETEEGRAALDKFNANKLDEWVPTIKDFMARLELAERDEAESPPGLAVELRPYQRQSLSFMLERERAPRGFHEAVWMPFKTPSGTQLWYSPLVGALTPFSEPRTHSGGFLAEDMGMGKTVEVLALILSNPAPSPLPSFPQYPDAIPTAATLVVCAVSLVGQWIDEANKKLKTPLRVYMYHGNNRIRDSRRLAQDYDLVVTTYSTLASDSSSRDVGEPLQQIVWHRVVLDESHNIKDSSTLQAKICCKLKTQLRWCCSGTPIHSNVHDLQGQLEFLQIEPFCNKKFSQRNSANAISGFRTILLNLMKQITARHSMQQNLIGEEVLAIPPKTEVDVPVELTLEERAVYAKIHKEAASEFQKVAVRGERIVITSIFQIMSLLLPLRRLCSGGRLPSRDPHFQPIICNDQEDHNSLRTSTKQCPNEECSLCLDNIEEPVVTKCNHWFCKECILECIVQATESHGRATCPLCRASITKTELRTSKESTGAGTDAAGPSGHGNQPESLLVMESKWKVLLNTLRNMQRTDETAKALIFSQFIGTLEWLKIRLAEEGFGYRTVCGSMPLKKRAAEIEAFQQDPPSVVFLLSVRSGAVGINLSAASHVFLLEPCLNPALTEQAVGRAWRMGQTRPVQVFRMFVKDTVEERILQVLRLRDNCDSASSLASTSGNARASASASYGKRKRDSLDKNTSTSAHGMMRLKIQEMHLLFS